MIILKTIGFIALGIGLFVLVTYLFMRVWNWLIPGTFKGPRLGFAQALGLLFLSRVLFGGFGHGGGHWRGGYAGQWRQGHHRLFDRSGETRSGETRPPRNATPVPPEKVAPND